MPFLFIDTATAGTCRFGVLIEGGKGIVSVKARSGSLLPLLASRIGLVKLKKVDAICVVAGPGSFSSVRAGVLIANLIARLIGKPLLGVTVAEASDLKALFLKLSKQDILWQDTVVPIYDSEPNITIPARP